MARRPPAPPATTTYGSLDSRLDIQDSSAYCHQHQLSGETATADGAAASLARRLHDMQFDADAISAALAMFFATGQEASSSSSASSSAPAQEPRTVGRAVDWLVNHYLPERDERVHRLRAAEIVALLRQEEEEGQRQAAGGRSGAIGEATDAALVDERWSPDFGSSFGSDVEGGGLVYLTSARSGGSGHLRGHDSDDSDGYSRKSHGSQQHLMPEASGGGNTPPEELSRQGSSRLSGALMTSMGGSADARTSSWRAPFQFHHYQQQQQQQQQQQASTDATNREWAEDLAASLEDVRQGLLASQSQRSRWPLVLPHAPRDTFYCHICLENEPLDAAYVLEACGHRFCRSCLGGPSGWLQHLISEGDVFPKCCHQLADGSPCLKGISSTDVERLVTAEVFQRYGRLLRMANDPQLRQCPGCANLQRGKARSPKLTCPVCGYRYCFVHGTAHPATVSCNQYERQLRHQQAARANVAYLKRNAKQCPGCKMGVIKAGGCNHMTCPRPNCRVHFCWLCGTRIRSIQRHYSPYNLLGCPMAMENPLLGWLMRYGGFCSLWLYRLLFFVLAVPVLLVVGTLTFLALSTLFVVWVPAVLCCRARFQYVLERFVIVSCTLVAVPVVVVIAPLFVVTHLVDILLALLRTCLACCCGGCACC